MYGSLQRTNMYNVYGCELTALCSTYYNNITHYIIRINNNNNNICYLSETHKSQPPHYSLRLQITATAYNRYLVTISVLTFYYYNGISRRTRIGILCFFRRRDAVDYRYNVIICITIYYTITLLCAAVRRPLVRKRRAPQNCNIFARVAMIRYHRCSCSP